MTDLTTKKQFQVPIKVLAQAESLGLTLQQLKQKISKAVTCHHPQGNKRYHEWVFQLNGTRLESIIREDSNFELEFKEYNCDKCLDTGTVTVYDECPACLGLGCHKCKGSCLIKGGIPCEMCNISKTKERKIDNFRKTVPKY